MNILIISSLLADIKLQSCVTSFAIEVIKIKVLGVDVEVKVIDTDENVLSIVKRDEKVFVATLVNPSYVGTVKLTMRDAPGSIWSFSRTVEIVNSGCDFGTTSGGFQTISKW